MKHNLRKFANPFYEAEKMERILHKQEQEFEKYALKNMENPFVPKMRPMMVNLVKELNEYKVIVDLTPFDGNDEDIDINVQGDELVVRGELDKKVRGTEKIINFTQTYYLDEKIDENNITKERKGNRYIITIPFKN